MSPTLLEHQLYLKSKSDLIQTIKTQKKNN